MDFSYTPEQEQFRGKVRGFLEKTSAEIFGTGDAMGASTASLLDVRDDAAMEQDEAISSRLCMMPATSRCTGPRNGAAAARTSSSNRSTRTKC